MTPPQMLDTERLLELKERFNREHGLPFEPIDLQGAPLPATSELPARQPLCALLCSNSAGILCCQADHRRAIDWAFRTGEPYTFVCHAGMLVTCTPVADGEHHLAAILTGKTLPERPGDAMLNEVKERLSIFGFADAQLRTALNGHSNIEGSRLHGAAHDLFGSIQEALRVDMRGLGERRAQAEQQAQIAETIHTTKLKGPAVQRSYPFKRERELIEKVKLGDRISARGILNEILGAIMLKDPMNLGLLKTRLVELLAVLSRASAEAGVNVDSVLEQNVAYFRQILECDSDTGLCVAISRALNSFLDTVCRSRPQSTDSPAQRVMDYLDHNYMREITVKELGSHVHLSPSRLSHVFYEATGTSMMQALLRVRIEKAKRMLLDTNLSCTEIGFSVGFKEQSYFTRAFRKLEKLTPRRFRTLNRAGAACRPGHLRELGSRVQSGRA